MMLSFQDILLFLIGLKLSYRKVRFRAVAQCGFYVIKLFILSYFTLNQKKVKVKRANPSYGLYLQSNLSQVIFRPAAQFFR